MLTANGRPVPSAVENLNAPSLETLRSSAPLLRSTSVPARPDTVPPICTLAGGGGGGSGGALPLSSPPPHAVKARTRTVRTPLRKLIEDTPFSLAPQEKCGACKELRDSCGNPAMGLAGEWHELRGHCVLIHASRRAAGTELRGRHASCLWNVE